MSEPSPAKSNYLLQKIVGYWRTLSNRIDTFTRRLRARWPQIAHRLRTVGASTTILAVCVLSASFLWPENVNYSFSQIDNCFNNPVFLPGLVSSSDSKTYEVELTQQREVLGYPIYAAQVCIEPKQSIEGSTEQLELKHALLPMVSKQIDITAPEPITVKLGRPANLPVATSGALVFHLSSPDLDHSYSLNAGNNSVTCAPVDSAQLCNLDNLSLKQNRKYIFRLEKLFSGQSLGSVLEHELSTVEPIRISKSSIKARQTVQHIPTKITLSATKQIQRHGAVQLVELSDDGEKQVKIEVVVTGKNIEIILDKPLKRRAKFELRIDELTAHDGGYLTKPFLLKFNTSGGPRVASVNVGGYGVGIYQSFILWLDSEPKNSQNLAKFVSVEGSGFDYSVSGSGKQITITPNGSWPRCTNFKIVYKDGLKNRYGVSGGSAWQFSSRTLCQQISHIGTSVDGRGIYAYRFGSGGNKILYVGGTHGDESSSVQILNSWINHLEAGYNAIPSDKTIIVVPDINPDGAAVSRRTNSNDVDLNRNFPANNWKKDVVMPNGQLNKDGGGKSPLSEPESSAIANYTIGQNPKLVLTYHAVGSMVIANESGSSSSLAQTYGQHTGYWALNNSEIGGIFSHDTTGAYEDWLHDKHGIPALLIELGSYGGNEFWRHQSAMRAMAGF